MKLITDDSKKTVKQDPKKDVVNTVQKTKVYISVPHHVEWKNTLRYDILVTDDARINMLMTTTLL